jgi:hypothetical protein
MTENIVLLDPADYLALAEKNGYSRAKAIKESGISERTWCYWEYQRKFTPSIDSKFKLAQAAIAKGWL